MATLLFQSKTGQRASEKKPLYLPITAASPGLGLLSDFTARVKRPALVWLKIQKLSNGLASVSLANMILDAESPLREEPVHLPAMALELSGPLPHLGVPPKALPLHSSICLPLPFDFPASISRESPWMQLLQPAFLRRTRPFAPETVFPFSALRVADR